MALAKRPWLLRLLPARRVHENSAQHSTEMLAGQVNIATQVGLNVWSFVTLATSRRNEHEADMLALCLMRDAGGMWEG